MSVPLKADDPAYWMLQNGQNEAWAVATGQMSESDMTWTTKTTVYNDRCYICRDPEFALMGLPLCYPCTHVVDGVECGAHTPADDVECAEGHTDPRYIDAMEALDGEQPVQQPVDFVSDSFGWD